MTRLVEELKRRKVFKVMASYAVVAWLLIQIAVSVEEPLGLPAWFDTLIIVTLLIGFPICGALAWIFDLTSRGIERTEVSDAEPVSASSTADNWSMAIAIGAAALLAITSAYLVLGSPGRTLDTIAVMPFDYDGNQGDSAYLGSGVSDSLISRLSRLPGLRIKASPQEQSNDIRTIASLLGVDAICRGRVIQRSNALEILVELIDADDGSIIWRDEFSSIGTSLISIENDIATEISRQLGFEVSADQEAALTRAGTSNAAAHRAYLQGRYYWNRRTPDGFDASIHYYKLAIELDQNYALAYSGLAHTYLMILGWGIQPPAEVAPLVAGAAAHAIQLDSTLAEPHAALGYLRTLYDRDWEVARREFLTAIDLNPNYSSAHHWYAFLLLTEGNADAAIEEILLARELEPLSPIINAEVGYFYNFGGNYQRALEELEAAKRLDENYPSTIRILMTTNALLGRREDALEQYERLKTVGSSGSVSRTFTAAVLPMLGLEREARETYAQVVSEAENTYVAPGALGLLAGALGDYDAAFAHFEAGLNERSLVVSWLRDPLLDGLHEDPRFAELLDRVGLQP